MQPFLFQQRLENNCRQCQMAHEINAQQGKPTKVAKYDEVVGLLRGLLMKKVITLFLICILIIFNTISCGSDLNNKSETILEKTEKMAENVYDAIKNHDSEQLKEQFCERLQPGKETAVDKIYEQIDGEIETLETDFETEHFARAGGGGKIRGDKLSKTFVFEIIITTDKGIRYEIGGKGDIINTIEPKDQGLQVLRVYKQNEDGTWNYTDDYLQIGSELD